MSGDSRRVELFIIAKLESRARGDRQSWKRCNTAQAHERHSPCGLCQLLHQMTARRSVMRTASSEPFPTRQDGLCSANYLQLCWICVKFWSPRGAFTVHIGSLHAARVYSFERSAREPVGLSILASRRRSDLGRLASSRRPTTRCWDACSETSRSLIRAFTQVVGAFVQHACSR